MPSTVQFHRVLAAPPERVYHAFLDPDAMAKWLPPHGFTGKVHEIDGGWTVFWYLENEKVTFCLASASPCMAYKTLAFWQGFFVRLRTSLAGVGNSLDPIRTFSIKVSRRLKPMIPTAQPSVHHVDSVVLCRLAP